MRPATDGNLRVCPPVNVVSGLDVSHWDGHIDWVKVKARDNYFCFVKASEGKSYVDTTFRRNWSESKAQGFLRGAYHFFRCNIDGVKQAELLLTVMGPDIGELPPVLDFETHDGMSIRTQVDRARNFLDTIERATGKIPIVYCSPGFQNDLGNPAVFGRYPLWVANYGVQCPKVPPPWDKWAFWQDSEKGRIAGISTNVDINVFNGSLSALKAFANVAP